MKAQTKIAPKVFGVVACAAGASLAFPAFAFASEGEESGITAILPNMTEFIPMVVAFLVLAIVLWKLGWPMFERMVEKRENTIKDALEKAASAQEESEKLLAEYKEQIKDAKSQANAIILEAKQAGDALKADITAKAQSEADAMVEKARAAIEAEKKLAVAQLTESVADLSCNVAAKVIGNDLSDAEHRAIIERYINEAGRFDA